MFPGVRTIYICWQDRRLPNRISATPLPRFFMCVFFGTSFTWAYAPFSQIRFWCLPPPLTMQRYFSHPEERVALQTSCTHLVTLQNSKRRKETSPDQLAISRRSLRVRLGNMIILLICNWSFSFRVLVKFAHCFPFSRLLGYTLRLNRVFCMKGWWKTQGIWWVEGPVLVWIQHS